MKGDTLDHFLFFLAGLHFWGCNLSFDFILHSYRYILLFNPYVEDEPQADVKLKKNMIQSLLSYFLAWELRKNLRVKNRILHTNIFPIVILGVDFLNLLILLS